MPRNNLGPAIRERIKQMRMTQAALARAIDESPTHVNGWLMGTRPIPPRQLQRVLEILRGRVESARVVWEGER